MLKNSLVFIVILLISSSCGNFKSKDELSYIAKYNDEQLDANVIELAIPDNLSPNDSLVFLKHFVNQWAREKAILEHAIFNLKDDELEIDVLVNNYKNALIKQRFEQNYLNQYLDTVISENQLKDYYLKNKHIFILKESIIKVNYVRVSKFAPDIDLLKEKLNLEFEEDKAWLIDYGHLYAKRSTFDSDNWIKLNDFVEELPIKEFQKNVILNQTDVLQFEDKIDLYLLKIVDYAIKDQIPPLTYVKDQVHSLILHQRKKEILQNLENKLFENALNEGKFEFY
ncbi:MAG: hypothetical protein ACPGSD_09760 [Flavobacteriales bacterium]